MLVVIQQFLCNRLQTLSHLTTNNILLFYTTNLGLNRGQLCLVCADAHTRASLVAIENHPLTMYMLRCNVHVCTFHLPSPSLPSIGFYLTLESPNVTSYLSKQGNSCGWYSCDMLIFRTVHQDYCITCLQSCAWLT